jgi:hypothetical protein
MAFLLGVGLFVCSCSSGGRASDGRASDAKSITEFGFTTPSWWYASIDQGSHAIIATVPFGTDVTALVAAFTTTGASVKVGATVQVSGTTRNDFSSPVSYVVAAADGSTATYTVSVTIAHSTAKDLTSFSFMTPSAVGTIDQVGRTVAVTVPYQTDVKALAATFTTTGASVKVGSAVQVSGTTLNDFTNPVSYTVVAADGSIATYVVTVSVAAPSSKKAITAFSFEAPPGSSAIDASTNSILVSVPYGTSLTGLIASFTTTGVSVKVGDVVQVSGITLNDFSGPVAYTVAAEDGSTTAYTVSVLIDASPVNAGLGRTGQTSCYDTGSNISAVIPCAGVVGQDGAERRGMPWPTPRFTVNSDSTITDELTGLIWAGDAGAPTVSGTTSCVGGSLTWQGALDYVACLNANNYLGHSDWRLPNRREQRTLFDYGDTSWPPALAAPGLFTNVALMYWTSTTYSPNRYGAWYVYASPWTSHVTWQVKSYSASVLGVWPVRGGPAGGADVAFPANTARTGQSRSYSASDDGALQRGVPWPATRFTSNPDGTVADGLTGLTWASEAGTPTFIGTTATCTGGAPMWPDALGYVQCLNANAYQGYSDWRLPNVNELETLVHAGYGEESCGGTPCSTNAAWLNTQGFKNVHAADYWSSTVLVTNSINVFPVDMTDGGIMTIWMSTGAYIWPVRGGN